MFYILQYFSEHLLLEQVTFEYILYPICFFIIDSKFYLH